MTPQNDSTDRVFLTGLVVNAGLAGGKMMIGGLAGSQALVADGVHSLSDIITNAGAWLSHHVARQPPDEDHHYGHGHVEALAALLIGLVLTASGVGIVASAFVQDMHAHPDSRGVAALAMAFVSIAANIGLTRITERAARRTNSPALLALARDNRSDVYSSVLALVGIGAAISGAPWVERLMAGAIGCLVAYLGWKSAREGFDVLTDRVADNSLRDRVRAAAARVKGVLGIGPIRIHPLGTAVRVELELEVDGSLTVREGHDLAHRVEAAITDSIEEVGEVAVHVGPATATAKKIDPPA